jgi:dipeptidase E
MKFYLSSFRLGNETEKLKTMVPHGKIFYIPNAIDTPDYPPDHRIIHIERDMDLLRGLGLAAEILDLRDYFHNQAKLKAKLMETEAIFISGGNVFVLRQAFKLSSLDEILKELRADIDFLYSGYSAAIAVLAENFRGFDIVDPPVIAYPEIKEVIREGLGYTECAILPHWKSDHPESTLIDKVVEYCQQNNIPYKTIRDGEVIIIE